MKLLNNLMQISLTIIAVLFTVVIAENLANAAEIGLAMTLTAGFTKDCLARSGGLVEVHLANRDDVSSFTLTGDKYTAANMVGGAVFFKFEFDQDSANFAQNATRENRSLLIEHILEFILGRIDTDQRNRLQEVADASNCGMFAIIKDANGLFWVLGFSEKFLKERPLELQTGASDTGKAFTDANQTVVTMRAADTEYSREFVGTIPV